MVKALTELLQDLYFEDINDKEKGSPVSW